MMWLLLNVLYTIWIHYCVDNATRGYKYKNLAFSSNAFESFFVFTGLALGVLNLMMCSGLAIALTDSFKSRLRRRRRSLQTPARPRSLRKILFIQLAGLLGISLWFFITGLMTGGIVFG